MALTKISTDGVKDDAVTAGKIPANAVGSSELADNAVDTAAIANDAVTGAKIQNSGSNDSLRAITSAHIKDDAVTQAKIGTAAVGTGEIADNSILSNKIPANQITNSHIATTTILRGNLANDCVGSTEIMDDAVTSDHIANSAINDQNMITGAVINENNIIDGAVTSAKIANNTIVDADINSSAAIGRQKIDTIISSNANNRVITGTDTANLVQGETGLLYNGSNGRLGINASSGADARLSVVDDSNNEGFNVKHSNLSAGIGIGYDTIQATGTNTNNSIVLKSKGTGSVSLACQSNTVASVEGASRDFRIHGNTKGWSTLQMDDQNYNWRKHYRRVNNGQNSVSTHSIARIKRTHWGWGYFELRVYSTYYYGSYVSIGYIMGHGNGGDHYSINRKKEIWTNNNSIGWGAEITKSAASGNSPGQSSAEYFDLKITLPNYTYSTVEFIAYSSYRQSDSDMANAADSYRLFSP